MTQELRDEFAKAAMQALVASTSDEAKVAERAYNIADAMLAERQRRVLAEKAAKAPRSTKATRPDIDPDSQFRAPPKRPTKKHTAW